MRKTLSDVRVQLLTFPDCPDADATRNALRRVLSGQGLPPGFEDIDLTAPETPEELRAWGSPTVLVNGKDMAGEGPTGPTCRLYLTRGGGAQGVPPDQLMHSAIEAARPARPDWLRSLALIPGAVASFLPVATCPSCLVAYTAVLSSLGLGFLANNKVTTPLVAVFLALGMGSMAWSARRHGRLGPLTLTVAGSAAVVVGRLVWSLPPVMYVGSALIFGASIWNLYVRRRGLVSRLSI